MRLFYKNDSPIGLILADLFDLARHIKIGLFQLLLDDVTADENDHEKEMQKERNEEI